jgi:SET domain-containing protein
MKSKVQLPKGWPQNLQYLPAPHYSKQIPPETLNALHEKPSGALDVPLLNGPSVSASIRAITSQYHPAKGQYGLFASRDIAPGSLIVFYIGVVHSEQETDPTSDYDLSLDRDRGISVDAAKAGNEARFINDYRGISDKGPNAEFQEVWVATGNGSHERRMAVFALPAGKSGKRIAGIKKGEEILVSYGKGFWKERRMEDNT